MSADNPVKSNLIGDGRHVVGITGTGAADPTKRFGAGVSVTRTATGVYRFSFTRHFGYFKGFDPKGFRADTASAVKGYTATAALYVPPAAGVAGYVDVSVWNSSFAAANLEVLQYMDVEFTFSESSAG